MGRKVRYENHRVEVEPDFSGYSRELTHIQKLGICQELIATIRRHVYGIAHMTRNSDEVSTCEFCGAPWTEGVKDRHNGGCCDQDTANMPEEVEATQ